MRYRLPSDFPCGSCGYPASAHTKPAQSLPRKIGCGVLLAECPRYRVCETYEHTDEYVEACQRAAVADEQAELADLR